MPKKPKKPADTAKDVFESGRTTSIRLQPDFHAKIKSHASAHRLYLGEYLMQLHAFAMKRGFDAFLDSNKLPRSN